MGINTWVARLTYTFYGTFTSTVFNTSQWSHIPPKARNEWMDEAKVKKLERGDEGSGEKGELK